MHGHAACPCRGRDACSEDNGHFLYLITSEETVNKKITCVSDHSNNLL